MSVMRESALELVGEIPILNSVYVQDGKIVRIEKTEKYRINN